MGAYGLTVAAAFAVALAVLLSVSSTQTAEAGVYDGPDVSDTTDNVELTGADLTKNNGDTVYVSNSSGSDTVYVRFTIETAEGASASFTHASASDDGQSILCKAGGDCDADKADTSSVTVALKIDDDSGKGPIFVRQTTIAAPPVVTIDTINVEVAQVVGSVSITANTTTVPAVVPDTGGRAIVTIVVKDTTSGREPIANAKVNVITTNGLFDDGEINDQGNTDPTDDVFEPATGDGACQATQLCQLTTDSDGKIILELRGSNRPDTGTLTASVGDTTDSKGFVFSGGAKNLDAEVEQNSVEVNGQVFVVFTVTDAGDNPVKGAQPIVTAKDSIVGPAEDATPVELRSSVDKVSKGKVVIPSCANHPAIEADPSATPPIEAAPEVARGTNAEGQCVIQVHAPADDPATSTDEAATRGLWTLNFRLSTAAGADTASVSLEVAGAPARIETDAPDRVDPGSQTEITVTVFDDEDVKVGITNVTVRTVDGGGLIEGHDGAVDADDNAIPNTEKTSDGESTFTYIAPSSDGAVELLITAGKATPTRVTIQVGLPDMDCPDGTTVPHGEDCAPVECSNGTSVDNGETCPDIECPDGSTVADGATCPEPEPEEPVMPEPEPEPTLTVQGNLASFSGGSVDDLAAAAEAACAGGAQIAVQDAAGDWQLWSSSAPAFVNNLFSDAFPDGLGAPTFVWVTSCESDAMSGEGTEEANGMEGMEENGMEENGG